MAGILIFLSFALTIVAYFFNDNLLVIAGALAWLAFILLYKTLTNKKMINSLLLLSLAALTFSYIKEFSIDLTKLISVNQYLLTLLIAVGFLRLVAIPKLENTSEDKNSNLPLGKSSFLKTYFGVHLFGSVINMSSLVIVADKMYKKAPLSKAQVITLTRAFSSDAYWSPFFVAFAAAVVYAPNLNTPLVIINGLVLALIGFVITFIELNLRKDIDLNKFRGYPISFDTIYIPVILAALVLVTNSIYKDIKIIVLISLYSVLLTLIVLVIKNKFLEAIETFAKHIFIELPKMKSELSLFIVAGMFGVSVSSILIGYDFSLPFEVFDYKVASILLLGFILLSFIGIHPIITIAVIGDYFAQFDHTLLAVTFLMAWSTTVSTSPFSGLNLTIVARYKYNGFDIFKSNILYASLMYLVCSAILMLLYYNFIL
ncbi:MAG: tellurium resistance protein TerC [Sulfurovum sp.]|jgi:hypothetical protein